MRIKQSIVIAALAAIPVLFQFCSKTDTTTSTGDVSDPQAVISASTPVRLPATPYQYGNQALPVHVANALAATNNTPVTNPITNDGATLGRVLFYDTKLSANNTISCGSCHKQNQSFSDSAILSIGFKGGKTDRHSMQLLNVSFYRSGKMFWDERANTLEEQVLQPIQNTTEMGLTLSELVTKVSAQTYYPDLFQKAFGSTQVTSDKIAKALAQFIRSIVTYQSKYDQVKQGLAGFTADEAEGENLFLTRGNITCANCHTPPMFITSDPLRPFGLPDANDAGINNQNRFKSGSLRNIINTAPYFHNGSVPSLNAMFNGNIPAHGAAPQDRPKLIAFLQTLTDQSILTDIRFSNPFVIQ